MRRIGWILGAVLAVCLTTSTVWAQGSVQIWSGKKGSSANPGALTADDVDANTRALNVILKGTNNVTNAGTFATQPAGSVAHDGAAASVNPLLIGGYASAAAPSDVSADNDAVRVWYLRNGSQVVNLASGGTLLTATGTSLNVNVTNGGSGSSIQDNTAFTQGTTNETAAGCLFNTSYAAATSGRATVVRCTSTGGLYTNLDQVGGSAVTLGSKTSANSIPVVVASDQGAIAVSQSGTWTVQPGNTANTTPWLVVEGGGTLAATNQQAVTASAVALASQAAKGVCVQALLANQIDVFVGASGVTTSTGYPLTPGSSWCGNLSNVNQVFVIASTTGASVAWTAQN